MCFLDAQSSIHSKGGTLLIHRYCEAPCWSILAPCAASDVLCGCCLSVQVYGIFFATSFLDLYRSPHSVNTSDSSRTVTVDSDEQYLFLVSSPPIPLHPDSSLRYRIRQIY